MHTVNTRKKIGFPKERKDWVNEKAVFDKSTLRIAGHPVMEDWELSYMKRLAKIASSKGGKVLEIGYGLGLSTKAIQFHGIREHFLIECHPEVITRTISDMNNAIRENSFHVLTGFWEDITPTLKDDLFDGILFDTYPLSEEEIHANHFWFFDEAYRLLKPGGVLTYYSDEVKDFSDKHLKKLLDAGFKKGGINFEVCAVNPPKDCEYWQEKTIIAPIITK
jgi:guanidinoacetate N-methyltransferase